MKKLQFLLDRYPEVSVLALMLLCLAPWMVLRDFTPANELRYLSIVDEALRDGHFFVFFNQGVPYADKPPLYFWLLMIFRVIFGRHCLFALSMLSFVPSAVVVMVMDRWTGRVCGNRSPRERNTAAFLLCSTVYWLSLSMFLRMDMLMVMFIVLALYAWYCDRPWMFALCTFLALFTKGPVGILMPPLVILVYILSIPRSFRRQSDERRLRAGRFLGWRFFLLVGGCCALWFTAVWLEGGQSYLENLLVHQTVDRTVHASYHQQPFWYYVFALWPVLLPWPLLALPLCVASLVKRKETAVPQTDAQRVEKLFRCAFFVPLVMLSLSSSKLQIYLLPTVPFALYLIPLYIRRNGWSRRIGWLMAATAVLVALFGLALAIEPLLNAHLAFLARFRFAACIWVTLAGLSLIAGGLLTLGWVFRKKDFSCARPLAVAVMLGYLAFSAMLPEANDFLGYRNLCREVPDGETVYVYGIRRPENMDVYLKRNVVVLEPDDPFPSSGVLLTEKVPEDDPALAGRPHRVHGERIIWFPPAPSTHP